MPESKYRYLFELFLIICATFKALYNSHIVSKLERYLSASFTQRQSFFTNLSLAKETPIGGKANKM